MGYPASQAAGAAALWSNTVLAAKCALGQLTLARVLYVQFGGAARSLALAAAFRRPRRPHQNQLLNWWAKMVGVVGPTGTILRQYPAFSICMAFFALAGHSMQRSSEAAPNNISPRGREPNCEDQGRGNEASTPG